MTAFTVIVIVAMLLSTEPSLALKVRSPFEEVGGWGIAVCSRRRIGDRHRAVGIGGIHQAVGQRGVVHIRCNQGTSRRHIFVGRQGTRIGHWSSLTAFTVMVIVANVAVLRTIVALNVKVAVPKKLAAGVGVAVSSRIHVRDGDRTVGVGGIYQAVGQCGVFDVGSNLRTVTGVSSLVCLRYPHWQTGASLTAVYCYLRRMPRC